MKKVLSAAVIAAALAGPTLANDALVAESSDAVVAGQGSLLALGGVGVGTGIVVGLFATLAITATTGSN